MRRFRAGDGHFMTTAVVVMQCEKNIFLKKYDADMGNINAKYIQHTEVKY